MGAAAEDGPGRGAAHPYRADVRDGGDEYQRTSDSGPWRYAGPVPSARSAACMSRWAGGGRERWRPATRCEYEAYGCFFCTFRALQWWRG